MRSPLVASLLGVALAIAVAGAAQPDAAAESPPRAADLPAPGSWAIGWSAAVVGAGAGDELRVLDSDGRSHTVAGVPTGTEVVDVRHDARRVITKSAHGEADPVVFRIWDVATGQSWQATLPLRSHLHFGPGEQLLSSNSRPQTYMVLRTAAGSPIRELSIPGYEKAVVTPGGTATMVVHADGLQVSSVTADRVLRSELFGDWTAIPPITCAVRGLWSDGQMRYTCNDSTGSSSFSKRPLLSDDVTRLVPNVTDPGYGFATDPPVGMALSKSSCEDSGFVAMDYGDRAEPVRPEGPWGDGQIDYRAIAGSGTSLWLTVKWSCGEDDQRTSLVRYDTQTKATTSLVGPDADAGAASVRSVQTVDGLT